MQGPDPYGNVRQLLRIPAEGMKSYRILSPRDTNLRTPCEKVGCKGWRNGWDTFADETTPEGREVANYIRGWSGRTFREGRTQAGITVFRFEPYQRCFRDHLTRPQVFAVTGGDMRGNPLGTAPRRHTRPEDWVEDCQETLDGIRTRVHRG